MGNKWNYLQDPTMNYWGEIISILVLGPGISEHLLSHFLALSFNLDVFFYEIVMLFTFWKDFINSRWEESSQIETALQFCLSRALGNTRRKSIASSKIGFWREEGEEGERNVASEAIKGAKGNEGNGSYVFILIFNFGGKE